MRIEEIKLRRLQFARARIFSASLRLAAWSFEYINRNVHDKHRLLGAASQGSAPTAAASTAQTGNHEAETL